MSYLEQLLLDSCNGILNPLAHLGMPALSNGVVVLACIEE